MRFIRPLFIFFILMMGCKENSKKDQPSKSNGEPALGIDSLSLIKKEYTKALKSLDGLADTTFVRLADFDDGFAYDLRYATANNFLKEKVYDCAECYTRVKTAKALIAANKLFKSKGVKIKFYDCYRPNSVQYQMWKIVPNPQYVADPVKGSIHNKGGAVDITLVTLEGKDLEMGTDFDFFGRKAYHDNIDLPEEILANRKLLKETMEQNGFWSVRTEWWHYNLGAASNDKVADFRWPCD